MKNRSSLQDIPKEVRFHLFGFFSENDILNTRRICRSLKEDIEDYCNGFYEYVGKKLSNRLGGNLFLRYKQEPDLFIKIKKQYELFNQHVLIMTDQAFSCNIYTIQRHPALFAYRLNNDTYFKTLTPHKPHTTLLYKSVIYSEEDFGKTTLLNNQGIINIINYKLICVMMDDVATMTKALLDIKHRYLANDLEIPLIFISTSAAVTEKEKQDILDLNVNIAGFIPLTPSKRPCEYNLLKFDEDLQGHLKKLNRFLTFTAAYPPSYSPNTSY